MIRNDRKSAERLFDAIGMIDDGIIAECQSPDASVCKKSRASFNFRRTVALFASLAVVSVCLCAGFVISKLSDKKGDSLPNDDGKDNVGATEQGFEKRFDAVLNNAVSSSNTEKLSLDEIDFFDGEINLIWTDAQTDEYYVLKLNESEEIVNEGLKKGYSQVSADTDTSNRIGYAVWISYGNGEVVSPELKYSQGNVGYCELFEYSREVVPSETIVSLIEKNSK